MFNKFFKIICILCALSVSLSGCVSLGPRTIAPDRIDYIQEISSSWKSQMLLNIVKLRYFDPPTFLDVSSIINQYGLERQINSDARWYWPKPSTSGAYAGLGGYSRYSDKPTITYTPLSGHKFTKNLLTPMPPLAIVSLIQNGWPIDTMFSMTVKAVNGVRSGIVSGATESEQSEFNQLVQALRIVQTAGVTDIRVEKINEEELIMFVISDHDRNKRYFKEIQTVRRILKGDPDVKNYKIVFGSLAKNNDEIALMTRSMLEIMLEMGNLIDVPVKHLAEKRVKESRPYLGIESMHSKINSSLEKPNDAFAAVKYQGYWFWVDNKDINTKRNFTLLMIFMSLTETEQKGGGPLLTIGG